MKKARIEPQSQPPEKWHWTVRLGRFLFRNIAEVIWTAIIAAFVSS